MTVATVTHNSKSSEEELESAALKEIIKSGVWIIWVKVLGSPQYCLVSPGDVSKQDGFVSLARVLKVMGLDLEKLFQIFVKEPWNFYRIPKKDRAIQPIMDNYLKLGKCRPFKSDFEGWADLAKLVDKEIRLVHGEGELIGSPIAIFSPNDKL